MVRNPQTNVIEPDKTKGEITLAEGRCEIWDLAMWADGRIEGTLRNSYGMPIPGVTIQAFGLDSKNERESRPLKIAISDEGGKYVIRPLPEGKFVVGVNARKYEDESPFPPTVYTGRNPERKPGEEAPLLLAEGQRLTGIDLMLPPSRTATKLRVTVLGPDGVPRPGIPAQLKNALGVQRYYSLSNQTDSKGQVTIPVFLGEVYIVEASQFVSGRGGNSQVFRGESQIRVEAEEPAVTVVLSQYDSLR